MNTGKVSAWPEYQRRAAVDAERPRSVLARCRRHARRELGDGSIARTVRQCQRKYFRPPPRHLARTDADEEDRQAGNGGLSTAVLKIRKR
jgi:hypothetical protein